MAVTEKQRHEFIKKIEQSWGQDAAETAMELLPPVGWVDVATKPDLVVLRTDLDTAVTVLRAEMAVIRGEMATKDDLAALRRDFTTWLLTAMGIQTAILGLFISLT